MHQPTNNVVLKQKIHHICCWHNSNLTSLLTELLPPKHWQQTCKHIWWVLANRKLLTTWVEYWGAYLTSTIKGLGDWAAKLHPRGAVGSGSNEGFLGIALPHIYRQARNVVLLGWYCTVCCKHTRMLLVASKECG